jgi:pilus assembly protein Flp/PilA
LHLTELSGTVEAPSPGGRFKGDIQMLKLITFFQSWFADSEPAHEDRGATMVEYALIVTLIALAAITGITAFGGHLGTFFSGLVSKF